MVSAVVGIGINESSKFSISNSGIPFFPQMCRVEMNALYLVSPCLATNHFRKIHWITSVLGCSSLIIGPLLVLS